MVMQQVTYTLFDCVISFNSHNILELRVTLYYPCLYKSAYMNMKWRVQSPDTPDMEHPQYIIICLNRAYLVTLQ